MCGRGQPVRDTGCEAGSQEGKVGFVKETLHNEAAEPSLGHVGAAQSWLWGTHSVQLEDRGDRVTQ